MVDTAESLITDIYKVFAGVTREGGLCMSQAAALDAPGPLSIKDVAHISDADTNWEELVNDPNFCGGSLDFCHLDPIGVRYYAAPAMIQSLRGSPYGHCLTTMLDPTGPTCLYIEAFNSEQRAVIARFFYFEWREQYLYALNFHDPTYHCPPVPNGLNETVPNFWINARPSEYVEAR